MNNPIYPCLWFDGKAKDAATFYSSVFKDAVIKSENPFVVIFELFGQKMMALNGGPMFKLNPSISFFIRFNTVEEMDETWKKLSADEMILMPLDKYEWSEKYGWVQDRFGVNWQLSLDKERESVQKICPALMFTGKQFGNTITALQFYTSLFKNSEILCVTKSANIEKEGNETIKHAQFTLNGYEMMAMDSPGEHLFSFNEAVSFVVECKTQEEIDYFWNHFAINGEEGKCGWIKDQFGISWQIVPSILGKLMNDPNKAPRTMHAFMQMKKFDIEKLINA